MPQARDNEMAQHESNKGTKDKPRPNSGKVKIKITSTRSGLGGALHDVIEVSPERAVRYQRRDYAQIVDEKAAKKAAKREDVPVAGERGTVEPVKKKLPDADGRGGETQE